MVKTETSCDNCIHKNICSVKDKVKQVKSKIMNDYILTDSVIEITVNCTEHKLEYTSVR